MVQIIPLGRYKAQEAKKIQDNFITGKQKSKSNSEMIVKERDEEVVLFLKVKNTKNKRNI